MSIEAGFREFLVSAPPVAALIGSRVYTRGKAPANAGRSYVVTLLTGAVPSLTLKGVTKYRSLIQVQVVADTAAKITALVAAVRGAISDGGYAGPMGDYTVGRAYWEDQQDGTDAPNGDDAATYTTTLFLAVHWKP